MKKNLIISLFSMGIVCALFGLSAPVSAEKAINLRLSSFAPAKHFTNTGVNEPWIKKIEEQTKGKVKIQMFSGSALGKPQDQYDMAVRGTADITWGILGYTPGRFPLTTVMELPFMYPSLEIGNRMIMRLFKEGHFKSEFNKVKVLALAMGPTVDLHGKKKPVKSLEDMKGMNIRTPSAMAGSLIKRWGGVPVAMPLPEVYMSLERGVIDAIFIDPVTLMGIRGDEVTKYHTKVGMVGTAVFYAMNKKTWDRLPADVQKVFDDFSGEYLAVKLNAIEATKQVTNALNKLEQKGHPVYTLPPQEKRKWEAFATPVLDEWKKEMENKGLPGEQVYRAAVRIREEISE